MISKIAWKNFYRQGLRAFLNVLVTALSIIAIIFNISLLNGFQAQATRNMVVSDVAGGHYLVPGFDLLTPTEWEDHTRPVPSELRQMPRSETAEVLVQQGQIFPRNRLYPVQLRGVEMEQSLLDLPMDALKSQPAEPGDYIPAVLGTKMAEKAHLRKGDTVVLKWRDRFGAVDAREIKVVEVAYFLNPRIDEGIVWLRLDHLRSITRREGEISWVAVDRYRGPVEGLRSETVEELMADLLAMLKQDRRNSKILWTILIFLAGISIFNTQILNVFKRQKEIGTLMAFGMEPGQIVRLFALEGVYAALGALIVAAVLGVPFFTWFQSVGFDVTHLKETAIPVHEKVFLDIRPGEVAVTGVTVFAIMVAVAWLPVRKISRLEPTAALRGKAIA
ncbi:MAG: ABC transporter permease [Nitrospinae bacterium]|nr:ABC transporter permease [Nitrospinota bacterium]